MLALIREQVPESLYKEDFEELPYNYDGEADYMVIDENYYFFLLKNIPVKIKAFRALTLTTGMFLSGGGPSLAGWKIRL